MPVPDFGPAEPVAAEDTSELALTRMSAQAAMARLASVLPPEQAEILVLRVVGGLPVDEVARVLGKRPGTVRVLQHRALRRVSSQLTQHSFLEV